MKVGLVARRAFPVNSAVLLIVLALFPCLASAQLLDRVSLDPSIGEYLPVIVSQDKDIRLNRDGSFQVFDGSSGRTLWTSDGVGGSIVAAEASRNDPIFVTLSSDGALRLWDLSSSRLSRV